ncbi:hypothetical protein D3C87_2106940 [compost metagenome]
MALGNSSSADTPDSTQLSPTACEASANGTASQNGKSRCNWFTVSTWRASWMARGTATSIR